MKPWSMKELKYLQENYEEKTTKEMAAHLNRSEPSVRTKINRIGLRLRKPPEYAVYRGDEMVAIGTAKECAEALNVTEHYVRSLVTPSRQKSVNAAAIRIS